LNVHRVSDIRLVEIYRAESLVSDSIPFEFAKATKNLKRYKFQGSDKIPGTD
jgi:hypothetical protein